MKVRTIKPKSKAFIVGSLLSCIFLCGLLGRFEARAASQKSGSNWEADIPAVAKNSDSWRSLLKSLYKKGYYYGAMTAANRLTLYFADVASKRAAYEVMFKVADRGYPFSITPFLVTADLEPEGDYEFVNNYNFYKYVLNHEQNHDNWANTYLSRLDKEKFRKYLLYSAIKAYEKKDYASAETTLKQILSGDFALRDGSFVKKVARTLARLYFEQNEYEKSLEIYQTFLLQLTFVSASDWLEAAWCLYHLKRYPEALGYLYNLESKESGDSLTLEKYMIRGLIYKVLCLEEQLDLLSNKFNRDFGKILTGIKKGEPLLRFPILNRLEVPGNLTFKGTMLTIEVLNNESQNLDWLDDEQRPIADYVYHSELQFLKRRAQTQAEEALQRAAAQVVLLSERLKFLKFEVARQRYNPDVVFRPESATSSDLAVVEGPDQTLELRWKQFGDYWREERLKYKSLVTNQCEE